MVDPWHILMGRRVKAVRGNLNDFIIGLIFGVTIEVCLTLRQQRFHRLERYWTKDFEVRVLLTWMRTISPGPWPIKGALFRLNYLCQSQPVNHTIDYSIYASPWPGVTFHLNVGFSNHRRCSLTVASYWSNSTIQGKTLGSHGTPVISITVSALPRIALSIVSRGALPYRFNRLGFAFCETGESKKSVLTLGAAGKHALYFSHKHRMQLDWLDSVTVSNPRSIHRS